jgi:hypothetical protein
MFLRSEWPSRLEAIFLLERTSPLALRTSKTLPQSRLSRGEGAIDGANETIDGMTNTAGVLVTDWFPGGEMAVEQ